MGCALLANHYHDGLAVAWRPRKAVEIYQTACDAGIGLACFNLASLYFIGQGVIVDEAKAARLTEESETNWKRQCETEPTWCVNYAYALYQRKAPVEHILAAYRKACEQKDMAGCTLYQEKLYLSRKTPKANFVAALQSLCKQEELYACERLIKFTPEKDHLPLQMKSCRLGGKAACRALQLRFEGAESKVFAERACKMRDFSACLDLAKIAVENGDNQKAFTYVKQICLRGGDEEACAAHLAKEALDENHGDRDILLREACRRAHWPSCVTLLESERDIPLPPSIKPEFLQTTCQSGVKHACTLQSTTP